MFLQSLPSRERGLKSNKVSANSAKRIVAPLAGAWIEIPSSFESGSFLTSLPSRERGLKFEEYSKKGGRIAVAPLAGAWIEILHTYINRTTITVAPLAGAWIEICLLR